MYCHQIALSPNRAEPSFDFLTATLAIAGFQHSDSQNYRWRLGLAEGEPKFDDLEKRLAEAPDHGAHYHA